MLQSCGPPLPIHRPGRFSFKLLLTFVDQCVGAPSCMKMSLFEFLSLPNLRMNLVLEVSMNFSFSSTRYHNLSSFQLENS